MLGSTRAKAVTFGASVLFSALAATIERFSEEKQHLRWVALLVGLIAYIACAAYSVVKNDACLLEVRTLVADRDWMRGKTQRLLSDIGNLIPEDFALPHFTRIVSKWYDSRYFYPAFNLVLLVLIGLGLAGKAYEWPKQGRFDSGYLILLPLGLFVGAHILLAHHLGQRRDRLREGYKLDVKALRRLAEITRDNLLESVAHVSALQTQLAESAATLVRSNNRIEALEAELARIQVREAGSSSMRFLGGAGAGNKDAAENASVPSARLT